MADDNDDLNTLLKTVDTKQRAKLKKIKSLTEGEKYTKGDPDESTDDFGGGVAQWATADGRAFIPTGFTTDELTPGCYEIVIAPSGNLFFSKVAVKIENLIRFPASSSDKVIEEIKTFWNKKEIFKDHGIPFKRGIVLYGIPGGGKSSCVQLVMKDIIDRKGLVVKFTEPRTFITGMRLLRQIQPEVPVVVIMEDLDSILEIYNESDVLNLLDGVDQIENCVFVATTNYPERLGPRIINRPSRFDKRFLIKAPNPKARKMYIDHLFKGNSAKEAGVDIAQWVKDTKDFSFAHIKELFVAVFILGDEYSDAVVTLKKMKENLSSDRDEESKFGFGD